MAPELTHPPVPTLWRAKTPGQQEFSILLGLLDFPALVLNRARETISMANAPLIKLCEYPKTELQGARLLDLLPGLPIAELSDSEEISIQLNRRKRAPLPVTLKVHFLDLAGQWLLLRMSPVEAAPVPPDQLHEVLQSHLLEMSRLIEEPDLEHALARAIRAIAALLDTGLVCIYQADTNPQLIRIASGDEGDIFPETISSSDLIRLSRLSIWDPRKRVQSEIHRFGRIANLTYVATTPLGPAGGTSGLLVVAHRKTDPGKWLPALVEISGLLISTAMQYYWLSDNLRNEIGQLNQRILTHRVIYENSGEGILVLSPRLKILEMNPAAEWMLGYANWEAQDQPVENILIGPERLMPALEAACDGIPTHNIGSVSLHRRSGQSFPAHMQTIPVLEENRLLAVIIFITDVSLREEAISRTQQLEHRAILGDVTAVFAHEVRNPINNISTGLQLISSRMSPGDPNLDILNRMEGDCTRLNHLMESVLAFSRPLEPKFEPVDLTILLQRLLDRWRPRFVRVNIEHFFNAASDLPCVWADPRAIEQVFTNLVSNAVEAMSKTGGTLAVRIETSDTMSTPPQLEITVTDNGPGIPEDLAEHIFEPFVTQKSSGTGLGLAITKRIITAHHGAIKLESFPGGGTVFRVFLPIFQGA